MASGTCHGANTWYMYVHVHVHIAHCIHVHEYAVYAEDRQYKFQALL